MRQRKWGSRFCNRVYCVNFAGQDRALDRVPFPGPTEWAPPQCYSQSSPTNLHQQAYTKLDWLNGSSGAGVPMSTVSRHSLDNSSPHLDNSSPHFNNSSLRQFFSILHSQIEMV